MASQQLEYKCPCCGGAITFDSTLQKMKCPFCDTEFDVETLQQYDEELNPQTSVFNNILGEQIVLHTGYQASSSVEPYYAEEGDPLWEKLQDIANKRITGDGCETTRIDGLMDEDGTVLWAYMESCKVIPQKLGGNTSGVQVPFQVLNNGNRHRVNFSLTTKTATKYT